MVTKASGRRFYVAPFAGDHEIPQSQWILVLDGDSLERQPFWFPSATFCTFSLTATVSAAYGRSGSIPQPAMPPPLRSRPNTSTTAVMA